MRRRIKNVEVNSDTVDDWHTMIHHTQRLSLCGENNVQGSQHFMNKKFPEFSLRKFQNSIRNTFPLMRLLVSQEVVLEPIVIV